MIPGGLKEYSRQMTAHAFLVREREEIQKRLRMEKVGIYKQETETKINLNNVFLYRRNQIGTKT